MDSQGSASSQDSQDSIMTIVDDNKQEILYFAYGSNLSTTQMRQRCPFSTPVGMGYLKGWKWIINARGYANIVRLPERTTGSKEDDEDDDNGVYGLLYLLPPDDEEKLDRFEGVPGAYQKVHLDVTWLTDARGQSIEEDSLTQVRALVYIDGFRVVAGTPHAEYVDRMERGIGDVVRNFGMDEGYANRVMRKFWRLN